MLTEIDDYAQAHSLKFGKEAATSGVYTSYSAQRAMEQAALRAEEEAARVAAGLPAKAPRIRKPKKGLEETVAEQGQTLAENVEEFIGPSGTAYDYIDGVDEPTAAVELTDEEKVLAKKTRQAELARQRKEKMKSNRIRVAR